YLLVGEPEKALDQLEPLLKMPYYLSPGWLPIDPTFAPLKGNPRFERLVAGKWPGRPGLPPRLLQPGTSSYCKQEPAPEGHTVRCYACSLNRSNRYASS